MADTLKVSSVVRNQGRTGRFKLLFQADEILVRSMKMWVSIAAVNATMREQAIVRLQLRPLAPKSIKARARIVQSDMAGSTILISFPSSTSLRGLFRNVTGSGLALASVGRQCCCCDIRSDFASSMTNKHTSTLARKNSQAIYKISPQSSPFLQTTVRADVSTLIPIASQTPRERLTTCIMHLETSWVGSCGRLEQRLRGPMEVGFQDLNTA